MERYFSIGQIAKLHNISVETLRHYDRFGLLQPDYINEKTGYRYYSIKSFIKIDLIKQCKAIGLSLEEIKEIINDYTSLESILNIVKNQKSIIDKKIIELNNIRDGIEKLENSIEEALDVGINKPFIKYNKQRKLKKYDYTGRFTSEFEMKLRKSLLEIEKKYNSFNLKIVFKICAKDIINNGEITYMKTMIQLNNDISCEEEDITIIPEGNYLTLYFDDDYSNNEKYYDKVVSYIKDNNINVVGEFYEMYAMTRVGNEGEEKSLASIEILVNSY